MIGLLYRIIVDYVTSINSCMSWYKIPKKISSSSKRQKNTLKALTFSARHCKPRPFVTKKCLILFSGNQNNMKSNYRYSHFQIWKIFDIRKKLIKNIKLHNFAIFLQKIQQLINNMQDSRSYLSPFFIQYTSWPNEKKRNICIWFVPNSFNLHVMGCYHNYFHSNSRLLP